MRRTSAGWLGESRPQRWRDRGSRPGPQCGREPVANGPGDCKKRSEQLGPREIRRRVVHGREGVQSAASDRWLDYGTNVPGATLIPPAFGLGGVNLHTWLGWGSVPHWNAFVANLEMHGKGRFFDLRLNNAAQFPIAAANGFADLPHINPDDDQVTPKLAALQLYQLSLPAPNPTVRFDKAAAARGDELFSGKAGCNNCHVEPLWTEPGGICIQPRTFALTALRPIAAPICVIAPRPLERSPLT